MALVHPKTPATFVGIHCLTVPKKQADEPRRRKGSLSGGPRATRRATKSAHFYAPNARNHCARKRSATETPSKRPFCAQIGAD
jgi:hypothetical protein